jgi:glycosyltransferase involved in cell wall biosynthesis
MKRLRILVLCYEYPPVGGGGGRMAEAVGAALAARGHEIRVHTAGLGHLPGSETRNGVQIRRTPSFRRREDTCSVAEMGLYVATATAPAMRHAITWRPDVIHCHFAMPTGPVAWAASKASRVPYVLTAHLGDVPGGVPEQTDRLFKFVDPAARHIWRDAAVATAVSSFVCDLALRAYGREPRMIPNAIRPGPEPDYSPHDPPRIVFAGRFNAQKNLPFFADVLGKLPPALEWRADLVGDGPDRAEVERRLAAAGVNHRVTLHGWQPAERTAELVRAGDVLALPSLSEGMPVAGIEALDAGLAIAGSAIPGLRDVLEDGVNGFAAPADDAAAFASALAALLADSAGLAAMRRASRAKAGRFTLDRVADQYEQALAEAAGAGRPTGG